MSRFIAIVAASIAVVASVSVSQAHSPYFSTAKRIILPNGKPGELRLLHGDGILGPDPIRVLALDDEGRMIARSHESRIMNLSCGQTTCRVFDLQKDVVLDLDPSGFRQGLPVPPIDTADREKNWAFFDGAKDESYGWRARDADFFDVVVGNIALAKSIGFSVGYNFLAGLFCASAFGDLFEGMRRPFPSASRNAGLPFRRALIALLALWFALPSVLMAVMVGSTIELWAVSLGAGLLCQVGILYAFREPNWKRAN